LVEHALSHFTDNHDSLNQDSLSQTHTFFRWQTQVGSHLNTALTLPQTRVTHAAQSELRTPRHTHKHSEMRDTSGEGRVHGAGPQNHTPR